MTEIEQVEELAARAWRFAELRWAVEDAIVFESAQMYLCRKLARAALRLILKLGPGPLDGVAQT